MNSKFCSWVILLVICLLLTPRLRAQEDADLNKMLNEAQEMQKEANELNKKNPPASKEKMAEMQKQASEEVARMEKEEKQEREKLQAALKKQLEAPGPIALPEWMPATPQFKASSSPSKKIIDDQVKIVLTGTSSVAPDEILKAWEAAVARQTDQSFYQRHHGQRRRSSFVRFAVGSHSHFLGPDPTACSETGFW